MRRLEQFIMLETGTSAATAPNDPSTVVTPGCSSLKTAYSQDFCEDEDNDERGRRNHRLDRSSSSRAQGEHVNIIDRDDDDDAPAPLATVAVITPKSRYAPEICHVEDPPARHWSVGHRLDTLDEVDNETDGTTTPGSALTARSSRGAPSTIKKKKRDYHYGASSSISTISPATLQPQTVHNTSNRTSQPLYGLDRLSEHALREQQQQPPVLHQQSSRQPPIGRITRSTDFEVQMNQQPQPPPPDAEPGSQQQILFGGNYRADMAHSYDDSECDFRDAEEDDQRKQFIPKVIATTPSRHSAVATSSTLHVAHRTGDNHDEEDDDDDDSAAYCATVIASDRKRSSQPPSLQPLHYSQSLSQYAHEPEQHDQRQRSLQPLIVVDLTMAPSPVPSPTHDRPHFSFIHVDKAAASPAPTNLTIDTSLFLYDSYDLEGDAPETNHNNLSRDSDETPVLDRYRLDRDEESPHGFRVVPNERGAGGGAVARLSRATRHQRLKNSVAASPSNVKVNASSAIQLASAEAPASSDAVAPSAATTSAAKTESKAPQQQEGNKEQKQQLTHRSSMQAVFRRTPLRTKRGGGSAIGSSSTPTIDENAPLNDTGECDKDNSDDGEKDTGPPAGIESAVHEQAAQRESRLTVAKEPSAKHLPKASSLHSVDVIDTAKLPNDASKNQLNQIHGPPFLPSLVAEAKRSTSKSPRQKNMKINGCAASFHVPHSKSSPMEASICKTESTLTCSPSAAPRLMKPISIQEYRDAPRIVRMQVSLEDVERAVHAINQKLEIQNKSSPTINVMATSAVSPSTIAPVVTQLKEREAKLMLMPLGYSDRKCKAVLMSLCHWKRLLMSKQSMNYGDASAEQSLVFHVL